MGYQNVYAILQNPKYTGRVVLGRRKNAGPSQRTGGKRMVNVPREHWTWAADGNEQCHRRMCGLTQPPRTYYVCPHYPNNPRDAARAPVHVRAAFRDTTIYAAVDGILRPLLNGDRAAAYTAQIPAAQAAQDALTDAKAARLRKAISQADTAISGLMTQLEQLGSDDSPGTNAYRQRIRDQFGQRYDQRTTARRRPSHRPRHPRPRP